MTRQSAASAIEMIGRPAPQLHTIEGRPIDRAARGHICGRFILGGKLAAKVTNVLINTILGDELFLHFYSLVNSGEMQRCLARLIDKEREREEQKSIKINLFL